MVPPAREVRSATRRLRSAAHIEDFDILKYARSSLHPLTSADQATDPNSTDASQLLPLDLEDKISRFTASDRLSVVQPSVQTAMDSDLSNSRSDSDLDDLHRPDTTSK